jgi:hypothetical protein
MLMAGGLAAMLAGLVYRFAVHGNDNERQAMDVEQHLAKLRRQRREQEEKVIAVLPDGVPYHPYTNSEREVDLREWVMEQSERDGLGVTISFKLDDLRALIEAVEAVA